MLRFRALAPALALLLGLAGASSQAQVKLALKYEEGSKTKLEEEAKTHQVLTINGMDIETTSEQSSTRSINVGKRRDDGGLPIETTLDTLKVGVTFPGGELAYDSADGASKGSEIPQLQAAIDSFKARVGSPYTIVLGKDGKVAAVEGVEKMIQKAEEINPAAAETMKGSLNAETLKRNANEDFDRFPDILLKPGDTWTKTEVQEIGGGQSLTYERKYQYKGTVEKDGKTLDQIDYTTSAVKYAMDPNSPNPAKITASDLKVGEGSTGTLLFDREAGRIVENDDKMVIKGSMTLEAMGQTFDANVDLTIEEHTKLKKG